jgi:hypothetical protein
MSFANAISLTPSSGVATTSAVARVFDLVTPMSGVTKVIRRNSALGLALPNTLTQQTQRSGSGLLLADRTSWRIDQTFAAVGSIPAQTASVYQVWVMPQNTVTLTNMLDLTGLLLHHVNTVANLTKILNGEP